MSLKFDGKLSSAVDILNKCVGNGLYPLGINLGEKFVKTFRHIEIYKFLGMCYFSSGRFEEAASIWKEILKLELTENELATTQFNIRLTIPHYEDKYIFYNREKVNLLNSRERADSLITLTMTTCKRFDLFEKTINSFINCCEDIDLIGHFICVDDNSTEEDRKKMKELYPFFDFYFKKPSEKGHPQSMNIIRSLVKTPYFFHMEDDFKFVNPSKFLTDCLEVVNCSDNIGQCLLNKNYSEIPSDNIVGGFLNKTKRIRYFINEWIPDQNEVLNKYGAVSSCLYWPHMSFRPSLYKTSIWRELGEFSLTANHFEMEYAFRYVKAGYVSAFLENFYCIHIGRLTSQKHDPSIANAYSLNNEKQFSGKEENVLLNNSTEFLGNIEIVNDTEEPIKRPPMGSGFTERQESLKIEPVKIPDNIPVYVINMKNRADRMEKLNETIPLKYTRFDAVNGKLLKPTEQLQRIFDTNDYNMRAGMVGCAMSHLSLYIDVFIKAEHDVFCVLEDDIEFIPDFKNRYEKCLNYLKGREWDMCYLGHHARNEDDTEPFHLEQWNFRTSLQRSYGGTIGYLITKKGVIKLLNFINEMGMCNCIDTMQQRACDILKVFYCVPCIIKSVCWDQDHNIDSDIQRDFTSLIMPVEERIDNLKMWNYIEGNAFKYSFNVGSRAFGCDSMEEVDSFYNRLKKYNRNTKEEEYNINDCLVYKKFFILN